MMKLFVTGIGTEIGKTVISSILVEHLQADYWKPIQSGDLHSTDTMKVKSLISNHKSVFHPEQFKLNEPLSPHASAALDGVQISLSDFKLPTTQNHLIIEGAGGLMVPINEKDLMIDLIDQFKVPVVLVSKNYLGSINHTLLTIQELNHRNIPIKGIVFNGESNPSSESFIENFSKIPILFSVQNQDNLTPSSIKRLAEMISF
ncbi:dethiobiotin synthase [Aquirufa sp. ROCK2-A2]